MTEHTDPPRMHGVVVVHGVGQSRERGSFLAQIAEGVANELHARGGTVERQFIAARGEHGDDVATMPSATIEVAPPASDPDAKCHQYEFIEAFWEDAFPAPGRSHVARIVRGVALAQVRQTARALMDADNRRRGADDETDTTLPIPWAARAVFKVELAVLLLLTAVAALIAIPLTLLVLLLSVMAATPGLRLFGLWDKIVIPFLDALSPFLTQNIGDATTIVESGMWSANARRRVVAAMEHLLALGVHDVAIVAYSGGAGIVFDALLKGSKIAELLEPTPTKLTFVSVGSGINRMDLIARSVKGSNLFAKRFTEERFDCRLTHRSADKALNEAPDPNERFFWLDIFARLDPIPSGRVRRDIVDRVKLDSRQVKVRQVINFDFPHEDHGGYFTNGELVVPRIIRSISGGEYPWTESARSPANDRSNHWPYSRARQRLARIARLSLVRGALVVAVVAHLLALWRLDAWRTTLERLFTWLDGPIVWLADQVPQLAEVWGTGDTGAARGVGVVLVVLGPLVIALAADRLARFWILPGE